MFDRKGCEAEQPEPDIGKKCSVTASVLQEMPERRCAIICPAIERLSGWGPPFPPRAVNRLSSSGILWIACQLCQEAACQRMRLKDLVKAEGMLQKNLMPLGFRLRKKAG